MTGEQDNKAKCPYLMKSPADSPDAFRSRLPNGGDQFLARDAVIAMEDFYRTERLDGFDDISLIIVAGRFGKGADRHFEILFTHTFDLLTSLEIKLTYPTNLRCLFLRRYLDHCQSVADSERLFRNVQMSPWFRRYASIPATCSSIAWRDEYGELS